MDKLSGSIGNKKSISGTLGMPSRAIADYNLLDNKPSIEDVTLIGNHVMSDFGEREMTNFEIQDIINSVFN